MKRVLRIAGWIAAILAATSAVALVWGWLLLRGSLPALDGREKLPGLVADVVVERDNLGTPTIRGATRLDVARATGFVHAQDRFFQMDLLRRYAAGEVSALFGRRALGLDRSARWHRFRSRAGEALNRLGSEDRRLLEAYADGVNAGLAALRVRPFEYLVLRETPAPWKAEDSLLVGWSMFLDLQRTDGRMERSRAAVKAAFSPELFAFFTTNGTAWAARLDGTAEPMLPIPGPEHFAYLNAADAAVDLDTPAEKAPLWTGIGHDPDKVPEVALGSNNWAVTGALNRAGPGAIVANDMHLSLRDLPRVWYRARFVVGTEDAPEIDVCGITLPGASIMVAGSNGHVAWGFTNSYVDVADVVEIEPDPVDPGRYLAPGGPREFVRHVEQIDVRGAEPVFLGIDETVWGPLLPDTQSGNGTRRLALAWVGHDVALVNFHASKLESASDVEEAVALAAQAWFPTQNLVVGDWSGRIAWTLLGPVPQRVGFDGSLPVSMADGERRWNGVISPRDRPVIIDPIDGRLWTANAQVVGGDAGALLRDGGFAVDGRARQIGARLAAKEAFDEPAMFEVQQDDETFFLRRWRDLLIEILDNGALAGRPDRERARDLAASWTGRAEATSTSHRLIRQFRREVHRRVLGRLLQPCRAAFPGFRSDDLRVEEPLWTLVSRKPTWASAESGWNSELLACCDNVIEELSLGGESATNETWGDYNRLDMSHPFGRLAPILRSWLGAPRAPLSGDSYAPNALFRTHGPSERMVVEPGAETRGILQLPGGQSGHPASSYFLAGHSDWLTGEPTPFLPGGTIHRLVLTGRAPDR